MLIHSSFSIYVIAWKSVSCTHMEIPFFGKMVNFLFSFNSEIGWQNVYFNFISMTTIMLVHDYSACKYMDTQHATIWTNSCSRMTHGVMQVNRCPDCTAFRECPLRYGHHRCNIKRGYQTITFGWKCWFFRWATIIWCCSIFTMMVLEKYFWQVRQLLL